MFFSREPDFDIVPSLTVEMRTQYRHTGHLCLNHGGNYENRKISIKASDRLVVFSQYVFGAAEEEGVVEEGDLCRWFLRPSACVANMVASFRQQHLGPIAGLHVRSTDNHLAVAVAPTWLYVQTIESSFLAGFVLFLATDSLEVEQFFLSRFKNRIISYPKPGPSQIRWPRAHFDESELILDVVDLFVLASCEFVVGSIGSSYSRLAALYNGDPRCRLLNVNSNQP